MTTASKPAVTPIRSTPFPGLGNRYDGKELQFLDEALKSNNLFYWQGPNGNGMVSKLNQRACKDLGSAFCGATSSGTSAIHVAVGASGIKAGSEVITAPITDMGTLIAILYQNAIPVFADVDDRTYNMTAESIEAVMTERTSAVVVIHLAGNPCEMDKIVALCKKRNVALIEDAAQSWGARYQGKHVGTFGKYGCMSLNSYKHLSAGDGGLVLSQTQADFYAAHNFADKCYDRYNTGIRLTQLCPNYRMTELQGAVGLAQFDRLASIEARRRDAGDYLSQLIGQIPGILPHKVTPGGQCSYWFYMLRIDEAKLGISRDEFVKRTNEQGLGCGAGYIGVPICYEPVFLKKQFFPGGVWPAELVAGRTYDYSKTKVPNAELVLKTAARIGINENYTRADVEDMYKIIKHVADGAKR